MQRQRDKGDNGASFVVAERARVGGVASSYRLAVPQHRSHLDGGLTAAVVWTACGGRALAAASRIVA